jgi:hypothetical protein
MHTGFGAVGLVIVALGRPVPPGVRLSVVVNFTEADALEVLRGLIGTIVPPGTEVVRAQDNRVAEPVGDFVLMTVINRVRLSMNIDIVQDTVFAGSIAGNVLTFDAPTRGDVRPGVTLFGIPALVAGTEIVSIDAPGTATLSTVQDAPQGPLYAGYKTVTQEIELHVQLDVHGAASGENVQKISTLVRDEYATSYFDDAGLDLMVLYAGDPRQVPFINGEAQWEERWTLDVALQANQTVQVSQQFADEVDAGLINVDATYPP